MKYYQAYMPLAALFFAFTVGHTLTLSPSFAQGTFKHYHSYSYSGIHSSKAAAQSAWRFKIRQKVTTICRAKHRKATIYTPHVRSHTVGSSRLPFDRDLRGKPIGRKGNLHRVSGGVSYICKSM